MISASDASNLYHSGIIPAWSVLLIHLIFIRMALYQNDLFFSSSLSLSEWHYTNMISASNPSNLYHSGTIPTWSVLLIRLFCHLNRVTIMKQCFPNLSLKLPYFKYVLQHFVLKYHINSSLWMGDRLSHEYKETGKVMMLLIVFCILTFD